MNSKWINKFFLLPLVLISGCDGSSDDEIVCTTEAVPAITISITDKSGNDISCGVTALIEDTNFSEELTNPATDSCDNSSLLSGAHERAGIYNIHVFKDGYLDWSQYNIEVTSNECHVNTISVEAVLEK